MTTCQLCALDINWLLEWSAPPKMGNTIAYNELNCTPFVIHYGYYTTCLTSGVQFSHLGVGIFVIF